MTSSQPQSLPLRSRRLLPWALATAALLGLVLPGTLRAAQDSLDETRLAVEKWMQARKSISQAKAKWETDKELMNQTVKLYERELASLEEKLSGLNTNDVQVAKERTEAESAIKEAEEALEVARQFAVEFEGKIKAILPRLPVPLREEILKKLIDAMPADPNDTKTEPHLRVRNLVGILNEIDKFNNAVNVFAEKRQNSKGEEIAVDTVYLGLGSAYFVNDSDDFAGIGTPGQEGWEWTTQPEIASQVREVIRVYKNERTARFIALPASIQ